MKTLFKFLIILLIFSSTYIYSAEGIGMVVDLTGSASVKYGEEGKWEKLKIDDMVFVGDKIKTELNSHLIIILDDESKIELGSLTVFIINEMGREFSGNKYNSKFDLNTGKIRLKVKTLKNSNSYYEVTTPTAIAGVRGTDFMVSYIGEEGSKIAVFEGEVEVKNIIKELKETVKVKANQLIEIMKMKPPEKIKDLNLEEVEKLKLISLKAKEKLEKVGEKIPKGAIAYLQARARGIKLDKGEELFNFIKEGKMGEDEAKKLLEGMDKKMLDKADIESVIAFAKEKGIRPEEMKEIGLAIERGASPEEIKDMVNKMKENMGKPPLPPFEGKEIAELKEGEKPPIPPDILKDIPEEFEDIKNQIGNLPPEDPRLKAISNAINMIEKNLKPEDAGRLIEAVKNGNIQPEEAMMLVDAIIKGAKPEFIFDVFKNLKNFNIDIEMKKLIFATISTGITPEELKKIMGNIISTDITPAEIKIIKEKLIEYLNNNKPKNIPKGVK